MTHSALAAAATLVALAFAACTAERWIDRRRPHELAWSLALVLFAGGAAALWWGATAGWGPLSFRLFYALGAVVNVPVLALGTVLLLGPPAAGRAAVAVVALLSAFAFGAVMAAPFVAPIPIDELPQGSEVFGPFPRVLAAVGSGAGALVLLGGAVWSAARLARRRSQRRLAAANGLIAIGTLILSAGGLLNSVVNEMDGFALSLVAGIVVIFAGFLLTSPRPAPPSLPPRALTSSVTDPVAEAEISSTRSA